jgi:hypothetical protein
MDKYVFAMNARFIIGVASIVLLGCATTAKPGHTERNFNAHSLTVNLESDGRQVLESVPRESAMDRFEMLDPQGRVISYIAFTDTNTGALVFVNQKLFGTLSHHEAQAFYLCRGHATSITNNWAYQASDWVASLLATSHHATEVKLDFTGVSTEQSITEAAESPFIKRIRSLIGLGTNPLSIFSSLSSTKKDYDTGEQFDKVQKELSLIRPGMSESRVAGGMQPEDVSFVGSGIVMSYPSHTTEFYVTGGVVKVIQQPSLYYISKVHAALFYSPDTQWSSCTPAQWMKALPDTAVAPQNQFDK